MKVVEQKLLWCLLFYRRGRRNGICSQATKSHEMKSDCPSWIIIDIVMDFIRCNVCMYIEM